MGKLTQVVTEGDPGSSGSPVPTSTRRPRSLFASESRLREAWEALADAEAAAEEHGSLAMTGGDVEAFIARFVNRESTIAARDEFADFLVEMEAFAVAKMAEAEQLKAQAAKIREGLDRMRHSAIRTMTALGLEELVGHHRAMKIKRSRGAVAVVNEREIPAEFWRTSEDDDLRDARALHSIIGRIVHAIEEGPGGKGESIEDLVTLADLKIQAITARRQAVDKKKIQDAWKEAGSDRSFVPVDDLSDVNRQAARVLGVMKVNAANEEIGAEVALIPGVVKEITTTLEIR